MFQIDPATKRNWVPACKHPLTVSYFYDGARGVYRIISLGGAKVLVSPDPGVPGVSGRQGWPGRPRGPGLMAPGPCASCPPQAIINSTVTPNMTFTKTSQKFGQWADSRANTVYGLGFASEQHLTQVGLGGLEQGGGHSVVLGFWDLQPDLVPA